MPWCATITYYAAEPEERNSMAAQFDSTYLHLAERAITLAVCSAISSSERGATGRAGESAKLEAGAAPPCTHQFTK